MNTFMDNEWSLVVIAGSLAIVFMVVVAWVVLRRPKSRLKRKVKRLGVEVLSDLRLPDGVDGEIDIDYAVLTGKGILVIDVKQFDGLIYGNEQHEEWTQVLKHRNYMFANPLQQIDMRVHAVKSVVAETPVAGAVLFAGSGKFPKRVPKGIILLEDLPRRKSKVSIPEHMQHEWRELRRFKQQTRH